MKKVYSQITGDAPAMPGMANYNAEGELLNEYQEDCKAGIVYGLTIRQHYAGLAMQATNLEEYANTFGNKWAEHVAADAVKLSDAIIAELNKPQPINFNPALYLRLFNLSL